MVHDRSAVVGIDPTEFGVDIKGKIGAGGAGIAAGEGSVWVANYSSGTISKVDPATGTSTQTPVGFDVTNGGQLRHHPGGLSGIGIGFGSVWASDIQNGVVYRIEPDDRKDPQHDPCWKAEHGLCERHRRGRWEHVGRPVPPARRS